MTLGDFCLWTALAATILAANCFWLAARGAAGAPRWRWGRAAFAVNVAALVTASGYLLYLILTHHFEFAYVTDYSSSDLPFFYLISVFWAGQEGSFLLWALLSGVLGVFLWRSNKGSSSAETPTLLFVYSVVHAFLIACVLSKNPFVLLPEAPLEGQGLNPLLQDPWMVIHPPVLFIGYAAMAIPYAFAMSALATRKYDSWVKPALAWALFAWLTLGAGIIIGAYWAYEELSFGGYWAWDPVENASLVPWLVSTALVHGLLAQRHCGTMRKTNFILAIGSFVLVVYATFLTRSGALDNFSVHSFVAPGRVAYLVLAAFTLLSSVGSLALLAVRGREIPDSESYEQVLSRDFCLFLTLVVLSISAAFVCAGTSAPLVTGWFAEQAASLDASFYNRVNTPVGILLGLLLGLCPLLSWQSSTRSNASWLWLSISGVAGLAAALLAGVRSFVFLLFIAAAVMGLVSNARRLKPLLGGRWAVSGGYLSHLGVAMILIGIVASSRYGVTKTLNLKGQQPAEAFGYHVRFLGMYHPFPGAKDSLKLEVQRAGRSFIMHPSMYMSERGWVRKSDIRKNLLRDLYISPEEVAGATDEKLAFKLAKGEETEVAGYRLKFVEFRMPSHDNMSSLEGGVGILVEVSREGRKETVEPRVSFTGESQPVSLQSGAKLRVEKIVADEHAVLLRLSGVEGKAEPGVVIQVSVKPLINLLWLGTLLTLAGGAIATWRRAREQRRVEEEGR